MHLGLDVQRRRPRHVSRLLATGLVLGALLAEAAAGPVAVAASQPSTAPYRETVVVNASTAAGSPTVAALVRGITYRITVTGTYGYGLDNGRADAECSNLPPDHSYTPHRFAALEPTEDLLDLYVNGIAVDWQPTKGSDPLGCNSVDHTYATMLTPSVTRQALFSIRERDNAHGDNTDGLTVRLSGRKAVIPRASSSPRPNPEQPDGPLPGLTPAVALSSGPVDAGTRTGTHDQSSTGHTPHIRRGASDLSSELPPGSRVAMENASLAPQRDSAPSGLIEAAALLAAMMLAASTGGLWRERMLVGAGTLRTLSLGSVGIGATLTPQPLAKRRMASS